MNMLQKNTTNDGCVLRKFTNKYQLSKTLRFELRPVGNTKQMLIDSGVIERDEERKKNYEVTKPYFDRLHQDFISESLTGVTLKNLAGYVPVYRNWISDRKNKEAKKKLEDTEKKIREEIVALFDAKAGEWAKNLSQSTKLKKTNHEFLFEKEIFTVLREKYGKEPEMIVNGISIFDNWDKWSGYFKKFFETRRNFYKSDGTATAVATRVVNENLRRFCDNIEVYKKLKKAKLDLGNLEKEFGVTLDEVFNTQYYTACLTQSGIDTYNALIGGDKEQCREGINQYINKYKQSTGEKLPRLKKLDKQIGSDKEAFVTLIENDEQLKAELFTFVHNAKAKTALFSTCIEYLVKGEGVNLKGVYFRKEAINTISRRWFASHEQISNALIEALKKQGDKSAKFDVKSDEYKFPDFINWEAIRNAVESFADEKSILWKGHYAENIDFAGMTPWKQFVAVFEYEYKNLQGESFQVLTKDVETLLASEKLVRSDETTEKIKLFSDCVLSIYQFAKYFSLEKSRQWNSEGLETDDFYVEYEQFYSDGYEKIVKMYDRIRNYMTKKPFNQDKWVLNFENPTLADGWDQNKESDNTAVMLRRDGRYYLAVMEKKSNNLFKNLPDSTSGYEKMVYKLFPDPAKMMPKVCFSKKGLEFFRPTDEVLRVYKNSEFKKGDTFSLKSMHILIDFYKTALATYDGWAVYDFTSLRDTKAYTKNIGEFYRDVAEVGYKLSFEHISNEYIEEQNNHGKLYLFEIHNKDWNLKDGVQKTGSKNTHTLYFEQVFSEKNAQNNFVIKLNGEAELFFRPATSEVRLGKRQDNRGKTVVRNKRYAEDKMFFHVPITLNRTKPKLEAPKFNKILNESVLANNPDIHIIGIDRGEKHLAYLSVINQKGEILEIRSLNKIEIKDANGVVTKEIDYAQLLEERAKNREQARRDWKSVEQIKDLKRGYIASVVREIADLIIKYNAIVVFEDLNMRFKQVRGGIEKSVYQQLEKALIDKLNFLVDKNEIDAERAGHILKAYQLTAPFTTFKEMYKQTGVLFYTQAEYTSQTDPVTGFRKNVYMSNSTTVDKLKDFVNQFDAIGWDTEKESYFFTYNPVNFVDKKYKESTHAKEWTVYAKVPRIKREKKNGYWEAVPMNPNSEFQNLFRLWEFDNIHAEDMKDQIFQMLEEGRLSGTKEFDGRSRNFRQSFVYLFNMVMQLRNSTAMQFKKDAQGNVIEVIEGVDFIASPVAPFFCTVGGKYTEGFVNMAGMEKRFIGDDQKKKVFEREFNGDANGAYNIARKGLILLNRISQNPEKPELFISRKDWDEFTQT